MKKIFLLAAGLGLVYLAGSCSDSTSSSDAIIKIFGEMPSPYVSYIIPEKHDDLIQANEVDSIKVSEIRILMSRMKLFRSSDDTTAGRELKTEPFVYNVDSTGQLVQLVSGSVPAGIYDKIKFEFHRFSASETDQYKNNPVFKDFATSDRYSAIIEGTLYRGTAPEEFTFNSQATANLMLKFEPALDMTESSTTSVSLQIDPMLFFKKGNAVLDPTDPKNENDIENAIKSSIKALKK